MEPIKVAESHPGRRGRLIYTARMPSKRNYLPSGKVKWEEIYSTLQAYVPEGWNHWRFPELTLRAAAAFPNQLAKLIELLPSSGPNVQLNFTTALRQPKTSTLQNVLDAFEAEGTSKGAVGLGPVYSQIVELMGSDPSYQGSWLEIGLGTTNQNLVSAMGPSHSPGASLRAIQRLLPSWSFFGADVDRATLFEDQNIRTAFVDQLDQTSFARMSEELGFSRLDVVIDDGLHSTEANLNTLLWAIPSLKPGGLILIEDVAMHSSRIWETVRFILESSGRFRVKLHNSNETQISVMITNTG